MRLRLAAVVAALALAACAGRDLWPAERLDPETAVNVTLIAEPWVYARPVPMLAANARDYLNLGIAETNRAGARAYWLGVVAWSTIDRSPLTAGAGVLQPARLRLAWRDGSLELTPEVQGRAAAGLSTPAFTKPAEEFAEAWYPLTEADVARLGASPPTVVSLMHAEGELTDYGAWQVNPAAMTEFLKATGLDAP